MKYLVITLAALTFVLGCGKQETAAPVVASTDLGKDKNYFAGLYGNAITEEKVSSYGFSLPGVARVVNLPQPFAVQKYASENMKVMVLFSLSSYQAVWVKYSLTHPWTDEQLKAALGAYDTQWSEITANSGVSAVGETVFKAIASAQAPTTYQSRSGVLAYRLMNDVTIYSSGLVSDIRGQIAADDQNKKAVPKF